jgi:hypothetical protein
MKRRGASRRGSSNTSQVRQNTATNSLRGISAGKHKENDDKEKMSLNLFHLGYQVINLIQ